MRRKNRDVGRDRISNCTLKVKADAWQRIIRRSFAAEAEEKMLFDDNYKVRKFDYNDDPSLSLLKKPHDESMKVSANEGWIKCFTVRPITVFRVNLVNYSIPRGYPSVSPKSLVLYLVDLVISRIRAARPEGAKRPSLAALGREITRLTSYRARDLGDTDGYPRGPE